MSLEKEINKLITDWGKKFADDLNASLNKALKDGGRKSPQEAALHFEPSYKITADGTTLTIRASSDYWYYIEHGRKPGKMPPSDKLGRKWQNQNNIDPRPIVQEIAIKYYKSKGFNYNIKPLSFPKASKQFAFIVARSLGKHGTKPRPFIDRVVKDGRIDALMKSLSELMKKEIKVTTTI